VSHLSYSQLTSFTRCAKQYQLQREQQAPEDPTVWLPAGKAIHAVIEKINLAHHTKGKEHADGNSSD
jgi:hypothetical protein